jgi:hypothetical protein
MKKLVVKKVISTGELDIKPGTTSDDLIEQAGDALDGCESHEILGTVLFQATDGRYYTMTVEAVIGVASKSFVKQTFEDEGETLPEGF